MSKRKKRKAEETTSPLLARLLFALTLLFAVAYPLSLTHEGFRGNEINVLHAGRLPLADMIVERADRGHPPLFSTMLWFWQRLAGESEFAMRFPSMLFGLAAAALLAALVRRTAGKLEASLAALFLLAHPEWITQCCLARPYGLIAFLSLLTTHLTARASESATRARLLSLFAALTALLHTHYSALLLVLALLAYLGLRKSWKALGAVLAACAATLPWLLFASTVTQVERNLSWLGDESWASLPVFFARFLGLPSALTSHGSGQVLIATLGLGFLVAAVSVGSRTRMLLVMVFGVPVGTVVLASLVGSHDLLRTVRYLMCSMAALSGLLAVAALRKDVGPAKPRLLLAALYVLTLAAGSLQAGFGEKSWTDWRQPAAQLSNLRQANEPIYVISVDERRALRHYFPEDMILVIRDINPHILTERLDASSRRASDSSLALLEELRLEATTTGAWVLIGQSNRPSSGELLCLELLGSRFNAQVEVKTEHSRLYHLTRD